jgi:hypothetical protein
MTEHKQLPSNLLVIDSKWVEKEMQKLVDEHNNTSDEDDKSLCITKYTMLEYVKNNSYQLTSILEDAYKEGWLTKDIEGHFSDENCTEYITNLITLKK